MKKILLFLFVLVSIESFSQNGGIWKFEKYVFYDSVYFKNVPYNSGAGIVHLGIDTVASSPTFGKLVRKTAITSSPSLTATYVGYGDGSNLLTGTVGFRWDNSTGELILDGNRAGGFNSALRLDAENTFYSGIDFYNNAGYKGTIQTAGSSAGDAAANDLVIQSNSQKIVLTTSGSFTGNVIINPHITQAKTRLGTTQGADVASLSGAIAVGNDGNVFEITGTNTITLISNVDWHNGSEITLIFTSTATLADGTANSGTDIGMELEGNTNFIATADDVVTLLLCEIGGVQRWRMKGKSIN